MSSETGSAFNMQIL